jgi:hypothetical protein
MPPEITYRAENLGKDNLWVSWLLVLVPPLGAQPQELLLVERRLVPGPQRRQALLERPVLVPPPAP